MVIMPKVEICAPMGSYAALSGIPLPTFQDNVSVSSSKIFKIGLIRCPEMSVKDYQLTLRNIPEEGRPHQHHGGNLKSWLSLKLPLNGQ
jgi:hypothetical protein